MQNVEGSKSAVPPPPPARTPVGGVFRFRWKGVRVYLQGVRDPRGGDLQNSLGVTQYCIIYKEERSHIIVSSTRRRGHSVVYRQQGGGVTQYCIIYKEERSHSI